MKAKFLGTGTSHGIPVAGCGCRVCVSKNPRDTRYRTSLYLENKGQAIVIDTPAEFRLRTLEYGIKRIDAVLVTHVHADHIAGLDDIRRYNELSGNAIPLYADADSEREIKSRFSYMFRETQEGGGKPKIDVVRVEPLKPFRAAGFEILPLPLMHGEIEILGFRVNGLAYLTDVSKIPGRTREALKGLDVLVLDALRHDPHPTHFNLEQAVAEARGIGAKRTYFTHIAHSLGHDETNKTLPAGMELAYDGLELEI